jgi:predicted nucleic acid-binding protein
MKALIQLVEKDESSGLIRWLPLTQELIETACQQVLGLPPAAFLRAADALHLACAADAGLKEIYSHDRHLLAATPHFGLRGIDIISPPAISS